jgi:hypothetical protein
LIPNANLSSVPFRFSQKGKKTPNFERKKTVAASHSPLREFSHKTRAKIPIEFLYTVATLLTTNKLPQFSSTNFSRYSSCSLSPVDPEQRSGVYPGVGNLVRRYMVWADILMFQSLFAPSSRT